MDVFVLIHQRERERERVGESERVIEKGIKLIKHEQRVKSR